MVAETEPDVVVMDIQMPHLDGIEATRFVTGRHPGLRVVMLTMNEDDETVLSAIRAGASGTCSRGPAPTRCSTRSAPRPPGGMVFGAAWRPRGGVLRRRRPPVPDVEVAFPELTERERDVLRPARPG